MSRKMAPTAAAMATALSTQVCPTTSHAPRSTTYHRTGCPSYLSGAVNSAHDDAFRAMLKATTSSRQGSWYTERVITTAAYTAVNVEDRIQRRVLERQPAVTTLRQVPC